MRVNSRKIKTIGKRIKKARKERDLTQERLAEIVGVSATYIGFIEQGQRMPSIKTIDKLARALKINLSDLFS